MFTLSTTTYEVLWEAQRLPPMPARIAVRQTGATVHERDEVRARALADAERDGLGRPPHLDRHLAELFGLLAGHDRAVSLRELTNRRRRAYAAASGPYGAVVVINGGRVSLYAVPGDHVVPELLTLLPHLPAGPGRAVSLPTAAFEAAMSAYADPRDSTAARRVLAGAGVTGADVERLLTTARDVVDTGSIGVHNGSGRRAVLVGSLGYADTRSGRYAITRRRGHTTVAPVEPAALRARVQELLTASGPDHG